MKDSQSSQSKPFLKAVIMVGHSFAGKSSICKNLLQRDNKLAFSVSATTRPMRDGEVNGKDYLFLTRSQFKNFIDANKFAEHDLQNTGHYYGTLWTEIEKINNQRKTCLLDVNIVGADNLIKHFGEFAIPIFISVPGETADDKISVLRERTKNSPPRDDFERRLARVYDELRWAEERNINHFVENVNLEETCEHVANSIAFAKREIRRGVKIVS